MLCQFLFPPPFVLFEIRYGLGIFLLSHCASCPVLVFLFFFFSFGVDCVIFGWATGRRRHNGHCWSRQLIGESRRRDSMNVIEPRDGHSPPPISRHRASSPSYLSVRPRRFETGHYGDREGHASERPQLLASHLLLLLLSTDFHLLGCCRGGSTRDVSQEDRVGELISTAALREARETSVRRACTRQ